jgi:hypothetical protein
MGTFSDYRNSLHRTVWMAGLHEARTVALGLLIAGFALAVVLAIAQVRPADLEAPGLKFVSPGIARK